MFRRQSSPIWQPEPAVFLAKTSTFLVLTLYCEDEKDFFFFHFVVFLYKGPQVCGKYPLTGIFLSVKLRNNTWLRKPPDPPLTSGEQKISWHFTFGLSVPPKVFWLLRRIKKSLCSRTHACLHLTSQHKRNFLVLSYLKILLSSFWRWPSVSAACGAV